MRKRIFLLLIFLVACRPSQDPSPPTMEGGTLVYQGLKQALLGDYGSSFVLQFEGEYTWIYRLDVRSNGLAVEKNLHIDGVSAGLNPGDIRLVSQGGVSRMRGPGTGDECLQFPTHINLDSSFLLPDDIFPPENLPPLTQTEQIESILGVDAGRFTLNRQVLLTWIDTQLDIWIDPNINTVMRYDFTVTGPDPLFEAGQGKLSGRYVVTDLDPQQIEPVQGCEIDLPLPADAKDLIKLPDFIAFHSELSVLESVAFFESELGSQGWEKFVDPEVEAALESLSFRREGEALEISIESQVDGVVVEIVLK